MADAVMEALASQMSAIKSFYRDELIDEFKNLGFWGTWVNKSVPIVLEAESIVADTTEAYIDIQLQQILSDFNATRLDKSKVTGSSVRGVPPEEVYARALKPIWRGLGNGLPIDEAVLHGESRLSSMFNLDIERVADLVSIERFANEEKIVGHRRILIGLRNCALCIVASTQLYHKSELKPIHPGCKCRTVPVISFENTNNILDGDLLEQVHSGIAEQFGISARDAREIDYKKIMVTREHGEYGPTLTYAKYNFTGPSDLKTPGE
jgi:hypothetical protein